jgi:hypothetical protein
MFQLTRSRHATTSGGQAWDVNKKLVAGMSFYYYDLIGGILLYTWVDEYYIYLFIALINVTASLQHGEQNDIEKPQIPRTSLF